TTRFCLAFYYTTRSFTIKINTLSLHDALPISFILKVPVTSFKFKRPLISVRLFRPRFSVPTDFKFLNPSTFVSSPSCRKRFSARSEEHTSELQSCENLVCRLLLENK